MSLALPAVTHATAIIPKIAKKNCFLYPVR